MPPFAGTTPKHAAMFHTPERLKGANVERAQSLPEQRHAVKEFFPIGWKHVARYYCGYLTSFVLGIVCVIVPIVK